MKIKKLLAVTATAGIFALASCGTSNSKPTTTTTPKDTTIVTPDETETTPVDTSDTGKLEGALTYEEYLAAENDTEVTIQASVQERTTWWDGKASFYLADGDGGYYVYNLACTEEEYAKLVRGTEIYLTGLKTEFRGEVEINYGTATENQEWKIVDPDGDSYGKCLLDSISNEDLDTRKNEFIEIFNLTVTKAAFTSWEDYSLAPASGTDVYFTVQDDFGNESTFVVEAYLESSQYGSDVYTLATGLAVGDVINLQGYVYYWDNPQVQVTSITKVASYEEFIATESGEEITITGYITARTTWWNNAASFYLQDSDGGYYVYNLACDEEQYLNSLTVGSHLVVTGAKAEWKGEHEINYVTATENQFWFIANSHTETFTAANVSDIAVETLAAKKNCYVNVTNLEVTTATYTIGKDGEEAPDPASGVDLYFAVKDSNGNELTFVVEAYLEHSQYNSTVYNTVLGLQVGDVIDLSGYIYYWETPQMQVVDCTVHE